MSLIPGRGIGVRKKILATPSVGVGGKAHVCTNERVDWASSKKSKKNTHQPSSKNQAIRNVSLVSNVKSLIESESFRNSHKVFTKIEVYFTPNCSYLYTFSLGLCGSRLTHAVFMTLLY